MIFSKNDEMRKKFVSKQFSLLSIFYLFFSPKICVWLLLTTTISWSISIVTITPRTDQYTIYLLSHVAGYTLLLIESVQSLIFWLIVAVIWRAIWFNRKWLECFYFILIVVCLLNSSLFQQLMAKHDASIKF